MSNRGTQEGTLEEISFVKEINKYKEKYKDIFNVKVENFLAIHVTNHIYGEIQEQKVFPKADAYLIEIINKEIFNLVNDFYISEDQLEEFEEGLDYKKIEYSGISIKLSDSKRYQITKINPSTFRKLFSNICLGAGASIYCRSSEDLYKNVKVLKGWDVDENEFKSYFSQKLSKLIDLSDMPTLQQIKTYSNKQIKTEILENSSIRDYVFKGVGNFPEPYTANWIFEQNKLRELEIDNNFKITTGSGRSRGDFTVVLKPS
jgi:predicted DNA-binding protein